MLLDEGTIDSVASSAINTNAYMTTPRRPMEVVKNMGKNSSRSFWSIPNTSAAEIPNATMQNRRVPRFDINKFVLLGLLLVFILMFVDAIIGVLPTKKKDL
jgi:hypothetical protein